MSTVTLSNPHCAITSAENPEGIASQAFTTALPEAHTFLTLFATLFPSLFQTLPSLREAPGSALRAFRAQAPRRSNPVLACRSGLLRCARNDGVNHAVALCMLTS